MENKLVDAIKYLDIIGEVVIESKNGFAYYVDGLRPFKDKVLALVFILDKDKVKEFGTPLQQISKITKGFEVLVLRDYYEQETKKNKWNIRFPRNEDFGLYGWSYQTKEAAERKIEALMKGD